jgi:hypothetical protein
MMPRQTGEERKKEKKEKQKTSVKRKVIKLLYRVSVGREMQ